MGKLRQSFLAFAVVAYLLVAVATPALVRRLFAIRPGVTLAGLPIGAWMPSDVANLARTLAVGTYRPALPAILDPYGGTPLAGRDGTALDVAATVAAAREAPAGTAVQPIIVQLQPALTPADLAGPYESLGRVPAPWDARAVDQLVILPRHPFTFALSDGVGCPLAAALRSVALVAHLTPRGPGKGCRLLLWNATPAPLVLRAHSGWLELMRPLGAHHAAPTAPEEPPPV